MDEATSTPKAEAALKFAPDVARDLSLPVSGVAAVMKLLAEGATVPFIARYRKEATGGLDEVQIRNIEERAAYVTGMEERRSAVLEEIGKQGKLTAELEKKIRAATTKAEIEDLYLPFKPKRRTRATIAKEKGLEPLADLLWAQGSEAPSAAAKAFVSAEKGVADEKEALAGARDIVAERIAESAEPRALVRQTYEKEGVLRVKKTKDHEGKPTKFDAYASFDEPVRTIPSHRYLAIRRGETEGVLRAGIDVEEERLQKEMQRMVPRKPGSPWAAEMDAAVSDALSRLLLPSVQVDVRVDLKGRADREAVGVFASNLRELLLAAPFGGRAVLGIDPGQRTGCKCAVVSDTGKLLEHTTIYLVQGAEAEKKARVVLAELAKKYDVAAVAVGNGTHGRETEAFAREVMGSSGPMVVAVSESGASVYSASDVAREELPDVDLTVRGAVSIARRLQDPLAELVKIDPKSIGVGQYQHDIFPALLSKELDAVVESCVNLVGVELNTASAPLLARVSGIGPTIAKRIVQHRDQKGAFRSRNGLREVAGVGPKTFEQCAGFLRIRGAENPLDASAVHPERYGTVERIAADLGVPVHDLIGDASKVKSVQVEKYVEAGDGKLDRLGEATLRDILTELVKPGRDPRKTFEPPKFRDDVRTMEDLTPGMTLEGVVTNVTAFGAFVDVGVHQDGLVHVSQLADRFVKNPSDVVKVGDKLTVRVVEIDLQRKRIALSARKDAAPRASTGGAPADAGARRKPPVREASPPRKPDMMQGDLKHNPFAALKKR